VTGALPPTATYQWTPTTGLNDPTSANPIATVNNTTTYTVAVSAVDTVNLVNNGDFESGNTGFTTSYGPGTGGAWGLLSSAGTYAISSNPNLTHTNYAACNDHTIGGVNMLVANGATSFNTNIWCQTIPVNPNTTYTFGMWATAVVTGFPPILRASFNNVAASSMAVSATTCNWQFYTATWSSGTATSVNICITNLQILNSGNDFAIDDITFFETCQKTAGVTIEVASDNVTSIDTSICNGENILAGGAIQTEAGTYYDTLTAASGCDSIIATQLAIQQPDKPQLGADTTLCGNEDFTILSSNSTNVSFLWNDNSSDSALTVNQAGTYILQVTDGLGCMNADTIQVNYNPYPIVNLGNDTTLCLGDERVLRATQDQIATYLWQDGATSSTYVVQEPGGTYSVNVTMENCSVSDEIFIDYAPCSCNVGIPNAITPNNDGRNDIFHPLYEMGCSFTNYNMKIFNRWGKLVFQSSDIDTGWDGTLNGSPLPQDSYLYVVEYTLDPTFNEPPVQTKGTFLLIR
jgi:gliding motility-associated-like protein